MELGEILCGWSGRGFSSHQLGARRVGEEQQIESMWEWHRTGCLRRFLWNFWSSTLETEEFGPYAEDIMILEAWTLLCLFDSGRANQIRARQTPGLLV